MEREAASAAYEAQHKDQQWHDGTFQNWAKDRGPAHPYHFTHGVNIGVAGEDLTPYDKFTTELDASPVRPVDDGDQALES